MSKTSLEDLKSIVKEIVGEHRDYERRQYTDQIENSWKTNIESKHYENDYADEVWSPSGDDSEGDFIELELVLEKLAPQVTYLQVQKLLRTCVELEETSVHDYYERYDLHIKKITVKKLYDYLKSEGLI